MSVVETLRQWNPITINWTSINIIDLSINNILIREKIRKYRTRSFMYFTFISYTIMKSTKKLVTFIKLFEKEKIARK